MEKNLAIKIGFLILLILIKAQAVCPVNQTITSQGCLVCPGNQVATPAQDRCICPGNSYVSWDGINCINCPATMIVNSVGDGCQCPSGTYLTAAGSCSTCLNGYTVNAARDRCICVLPKVESGGFCVCPANFIVDASGACVCDNNYIYSNGDCICPYPLIDSGLSCTCPAPYIADATGKNCICPAGKVFSSGQCVCPPPFEQDSTGNCVCPAGFTPSGGTCVGCGNGVVEGLEQCDSTVGCNSTCKCINGYFAISGVCRSNAVCGNGIIQSGQVCDNGNNVGCSKFCQVDPGYQCASVHIPGTNPKKYKSACIRTCGNAILDAGQECDNGGQIGCSFNCKTDKGYHCTGVIGQKSACSTACGDGIRDASQACDNGNRLGCTNCMVDAGFSCVGLIGATSRCTRIPACGNGILQAGEKCDNGGRLGCLNNCKPDPGYTCIGTEGTASTCSQCGNSIIEPGQQCDNGGQLGCRFNCRVENGYTCKGIGSSNCFKADSRCGNGVIEIAEACDDGNKNNGDGCNYNCVVEPSYKCVGQFGEKSICSKLNSTDKPQPICGNNKYEPMTQSSNNQGRSGGLNGFNPTNGSFGFNAYYGEQCDNGNQPGCRGCVVEKDWTCTKVPNQPSICTPNIVINPCGNGIYEPGRGQTCDDGNFDNGDGCNMFCQVQPYWVCPNGIKCQLANAYVPQSCGNGKYEPSKGEQCDDGNIQNSDGCSSRCKVETGYICGEFCASQSNPRCVQRVQEKRSSCKKSYAFCGNGIVDGIQQCDDGFPLFNGDGCNNRCKIQKGYNCYGNPSKCFKI